MTEKLQSRKLWVYIITTVLLVLSFIASIFIKSMDLSKVVEILAEGYIWVSALYLGANAAQKIFLKDKNEVTDNGQDITVR
jgi:hypothetical protein